MLTLTKRQSWPASLLKSSLLQHRHRGEDVQYIPVQIQSHIKLMLLYNIDNRYRTYLITAGAPSGLALAVDGGPWLLAGGTNWWPGIQPFMLGLGSCKGSPSHWEGGPSPVAMPGAATSNLSSHSLRDHGKEAKHIHNHKAVEKTPYLRCACSASQRSQSSSPQKTNVYGMHL